MSSGKQYDSKRKCPECNKRKVYFIISSDGKKVEYTCTACGNTWRG